MTQRTVLTPLGSRPRQSELPTMQTTARDQNGDPQLTAAQQRAMAQAIIRSAALARNEIADAPAEAQPVSALMPLAERMAAEAVPRVLPEMPAPSRSPNANISAAEIIAAGKRRRGEI